LAVLSIIICARYQALALLFLSFLHTLPYFTLSLPYFDLLYPPAIESLVATSVANNCVNKGVLYIKLSLLRSVYQAFTLAFYISSFHSCVLYIKLSLLRSIFKLSLLSYPFLPSLHYQRLKALLQRASQNIASTKAKLSQVGAVNVARFCQYYCLYSFVPYQVGAVTLAFLPILLSSFIALYSFVPYQVGAITLASVYYCLPCLCYQTLTLDSFLPFLPH
jgi:hypothetical protein